MLAALVTAHCIARRTRLPSPDDTIARLLRLAAEAGLEGVVRSVSYGTPSLKVRSKFLCRLKDTDTLAIRCPAEEKAMLMEAEPAFFFETEHYRGHDSLLVRLHGIDDGRLKARLTRACEMQAGTRKSRPATTRR